jgi:hypothetical protein
MLNNRQRGYNFAVEAVTELPDMPREVLERTRASTEANKVKYKLLGFDEDSMEYVDGLLEACDDMLRVM